MRPPHRAAFLLLASFVAACARTPEPAPAQVTATAAPSAAPAPAVHRIEADVRYLADDLLEGREAGTRGHDLAALYFATRCAAIGLVPAGDNGSWFQEVPMLRGVREREGSRLAVTRDGKTTELAFETDFLPGINYSNPTATVTAPLVFVGFGVHAPDLDWDDYADIEVKGKIAVMLNGAPDRFNVDQRAFHASGLVKSRELEARGAIGVVTLRDPDEEARRPWTMDSPNWRRPGMRLVDVQGAPVDDFPGLQVRAGVTLGVAALMLEGSGVAVDALWAGRKAGTIRPFALAGTATITGNATLDRVTSRNVVAKLPGSDPALASEHIVLSAHLDHLGIGAAVDGDTIYNGAVDNALGIGILLEAARALRADPPRRSVLFLATTAEEKGLLGAHRYAREPTVPAESLVANINMDMPVILTPLSDAVPIGLEHSSLQGVVEGVAKAMGITLTPDPFPEEVVFIRSDQYAFIRQGIPAVYLDGGVKSTESGVDGVALVRDFLATHYHRPSDDLSRPIHWPTAVRLAELNERITREIGNADQRPRWNKDDFFGNQFGTPATRAQ